MPALPPFSRILVAGCLEREKGKQMKLVLERAAVVAGLVLLLLFFSAERAQSATLLSIPLQKGKRTLTREEGEEIAAAAREHRKSINRTLDCSHLTHQVFAFAGFAYDYAPSDMIFRGMRGFKRVKKPQAGDVVAWRGHVGVVVDPKGKTFYSWHSDGASDRNYDSRYWRGRGEMRFYRYVVPRKVSLASAE